MLDSRKKIFVAFGLCFLGFFWVAPQALAQYVPPTPTPTVTPIFTVTPTVTPIPQGNVVQCPEGFVQTISGSNIICLQQIQNQAQNQSASANANASTGPINVSSTNTNTNTVNNPVNPVVMVTPVPQARGGVGEVKELPKTGLPVLAWALSGLLPFGVGLRKLTGQKHEQKQTFNYLLQKREFDKNF